MSTYVRTPLNAVKCGGSAANVPIVSKKNSNSATPCIRRIRLQYLGFAAQQRSTVLLMSNT